MNAEMWLDDLHWMAGVFESEGSIRINRPNSRNMASLAVDVPNTDESMVRPFHAMWGGSMVRHESAPPQRPYWRWRCTGTGAQAFLLAMWPLLRTDRVREKADLGLVFQSQKTPTYGRRHASPSYVSLQWAMYEEMKRLNIRGVLGRPTAPAPIRFVRVPPLFDRLDVEA